MKISTRIPAYMWTTTVLVFSMLALSVEGKSTAFAKVKAVPLEDKRNPPVFIEEDARGNVTTEVRQNAQLDCPFAGSPTPFYEWYKGNERVRKGGGWDRFGPDDGRVMIIRSVTPEDSGTYLCRAVNGFGSKDFSIELHVSGADALKLNLLKQRAQKYEGNDLGGSLPEIMTDNLPRIIKEIRGRDVILKCEANGNPKPLVTWFKDNKNLTIPVESSSRLHLQNLTEKENGRYRCEAKNLIGKDDYDIEVSVAEAYLGIVEVRELNPSNLTLFPGQSGSITCLARIEGPATPFVVWVKKVENLSESDSQNKLVEHEGSHYKYLNRTGTDVREVGKNLYATTLMITNATFEDAGIYHCAAVGPMGINNHAAHVFVENDPQHVRSVMLEKQKSATVQRAILWAFAFLILVGILITCFGRLYGCRGPLKNSQKLNGVVVVSRPVSDKKTALPKRSPGETMSTTLTQHQADVLQPLVFSSTGHNSRTVSTAISAPRHLAAVAPTAAHATSRHKSIGDRCRNFAHNQSSHGFLMEGEHGRRSDSEESSVSKFMSYPEPGEDVSSRYFVNDIDLGERYCPHGCYNDNAIIITPLGHATSKYEEGDGQKWSKGRRKKRSRSNQDYHHQLNLDPVISNSNTRIPPPVPAPSSTCSSITFPSVSSSYTSSSAVAHCTETGFKYYRNPRKSHQHISHHHHHVASNFTSDHLLTNPSCKYCNT